MTLTRSFGFGVLIGLLGIGAAVLGVAIEGDEGGGWGGLLLVPVVAASILLFSLVTSFLGRPSDVGVVAAAGVALTLMIAATVRTIQLGEGGSGIVVSVVLGVGALVILGIVARAAWFVGDGIASAMGLPTERRLVAKVYGVDRSGSTWVDDAREQLDLSLRELADTELPGGVDVTAIGVQHRAVRTEPVALALGRSTLVIRPLRMNGHLDGDAIRIDASGIASASIRSQDRDGARRRVVNVYDDVIELHTADGRRLRLSLPYGGDAGTASPEEHIRTWIRQHAAIYT